MIYKMNSGLAQRQFLEGKKIGIVINDAAIKIKRLRCVPVRLNFMPRVSFLKCYLPDCFFSAGKVGANKYFWRGVE